MPVQLGQDFVNNHLMAPDSTEQQIVDMCRNRIANQQVGDDMHAVVNTVLLSTEDNFINVMQNEVVGNAGN